MRSPVCEGRSSSASAVDMASRENTTSNPPRIDDMSVGDRSSILSSRMTDIASEDGRGQPAAEPARLATAPRPGKRRSVQTPSPSTGPSRVSSRRGVRPPSARRGYVSNSQRSSTATGPRPQSGRSHVPSLTSHAFFHPMSSQRLQAQRGGTRPTQPSLAEGQSFGGDVRDSVISNQTARHDDQDGRLPSRGTEMTEQEFMERVANTSPVPRHNAESVADSVRPLQRDPANKKGLSLNLDKSYKNGIGSAAPAPAKSPRSFRSSFLLGSRNEILSGSPSRSMQGREKLSSTASSPGLAPNAAKELPTDAKLGSNYEYFTGNTIFFWGGRLQNTRHRPLNIATGLLLIIPGVLFFIFSAPWLWHHISPAIPLFFAYIYYLALSSFVHASLSDPGVRRNSA